jgi:hypothetical protein
MLRIKYAPALLAAAVASCGGSDQHVNGATQNTYASIQSITATPAQPTPGGTVQLVAVTRDPEGDALAYAWSDDCGGTFADTTTPTTTWTAPAAPATCNVQLEIVEIDVPEHSAVFNARTIAVKVVAPQPVAVYESFPAPVPPSLVSESFQATATSEFGDSVTLAGTARKADKAAFVMVTWDQHAYTYPITLNLYATGDLVHPFATVTQQFDIPARPPADPSCTDGRWLASDGCHYGFAFPVTFDLTGVTLPDTFVYGIAYNTQTYGAQPTGQDGYYNSLNVGLVSAAPTVGSRVDGTVYQNSSWSGAYQGTGTPGQFGPDTNWNIHVPARFTAFQ